MAALAQPNHSGVPVGLLRMVQSWTWVKEAAPAIPPTASRIATRATPSTRSAVRRRGAVASVIGWSPSLVPVLDDGDAAPTAQQQTGHHDHDQGDGGDGADGAAGDGVRGGAV